MTAQGFSQVLIHSVPVIINAGTSGMRFTTNEKSNNAGKALFRLESEKHSQLPAALQVPKKQLQHLSIL
jgi:hypothetical protein